MSDLSIQSNAKSEAEQEAVLTLIFDEMNHIQEMMRQDRVEIDRLKAETSLLKREAEFLRHESLTILSRLQTMV